MLIMLYLINPKKLYDGRRYCECLGVKRNTNSNNYCMGIIFNCQDLIFLPTSGN